MISTIKKGKHRPGNWWRCLALWHKQNNISRQVAFDYSAKYLLPAEDTDDVNKLFGIGYLWNHHKESARFGWDWNDDKSTINLFAYTYVGGKRDFRKICEINRYVKYRLAIEVYPDGYEFTVFDINKSMMMRSLFVVHHHKKKWSFHLGLFFGGNRTAPHPITIEIKK
jgi:hypothetical protein